MATPGQDAPRRDARLAELERGTTTAAALVFFDALPAAEVDAIAGTWRGSVLPTGHRLDGLLQAVGWYGKRFAGWDADPLLVDDGRGRVVAVNPAWVPLGLVLRCARVLARRPVARVVRAVLPVLRTRRARARLRATVHRGVVTATMTYDALPVDDVLRAVDEDTLVGLMEARDMPRPFFFVLRRVSAGGGSSGPTSAATGETRPS